MMITILLIPIVTAILCYLLRNHRLIGYVNLGGAVILSIVAVPVIVSAIASPIGHSGMFNGMFYMDALSGYKQDKGEDCRIEAISPFLQSYE